MLIRRLVKERIASTFISKDGNGRVFLAGDAAHVHSVNGGQGLNTGIADAFSLSWRLAMALKPQGIRSEAVSAIVQSYDTERRSTAQGVIDVAAALVRDTVKDAKTYVATIQRNAGYITGMGVAYDKCDSPVVTTSEAGIWKAGMRCPDVAMTPVAGGDSTWLYKQATYGKYLALSVGGPEPIEVGKDSHVYAIEINNTNSDKGSFASDEVRSEDKAVVVVRPDMYIAYVAKDEADCKEYLATLFE